MRVDGVSVTGPLAVNVFSANEQEIMLANTAPTWKGQEDTLVHYVATSTTSLIKQRCLSMCIGTIMTLNPREWKGCGSHM